MAELLTTLKIPFQQQVPIGRWIVDFLTDQTVIEVHGGYWHDRPQAKLRDQRKRETLESMGYQVIFCRTDRMHLWWQDLSALLKEN